MNDSNNSSSGSNSSSNNNNANSSSSSSSSSIVLVLGSYSSDVRQLSNSQVALSFVRFLFPRLLLESDLACIGCLGRL
ncbi:hypothetical protein V1478_016144 [Vespula squamosa]|uniref:Uncharacterized protein n=1 Tax=Vespula squamosa TaxID=30214 RepID=A0ABD1ZZK6_VESSQ